MSIADNEFPNALFASPETAVAGFSLLRTALRSDPTLYKPSDVYLLGVLRATRPDGRAGYCYRAQYANLPEYVYGPGGTGSDREVLERDGWTFEALEETRWSVDVQRLWNGRPAPRAPQYK